MWNLDSGFVSEIPDSFSCIPGPKAQNFGFHRQTFFRVPNFPDSGTEFPYMERMMPLGKVPLILLFTVIQLN